MLRASFDCTASFTYLQTESIKLAMETLEIDRVGTTAVVTMNRPDHRNALDQIMREEFVSVIAKVRDDPEIRAVVLTGAGGHFCAGGDVKGMAANAALPKDVFRMRRNLRDLHRWFDELVDLEKPVIAAVDGVSFGAGLSLALASDFIIASPRATFCSVFSRIGLVPDLGAMYLLPRAIGLSRAKEMVFSARVVKADEALTMGLVHAIAKEDVLQEALRLAARFANAPVDAIGIAKGIMNHAFESDRPEVYAREALAQAVCRESSFHVDAVDRFVTKRPPIYNWSD